MFWRTKLYKIVTDIDGQLAIDFFIIKRRRVLGRCSIIDLDISPTIDSLFVVEDERGKGLGKRLVRECEEYINKNSSCNYLLVDVSIITDIRKFYKKLGYRYIKGSTIEGERVTMMRRLN